MRTTRRSRDNRNPRADARPLVATLVVIAALAIAATAFVAMEVLDPDELASTPAGTDSPVSESPTTTTDPAAPVPEPTTTVAPTTTVTTTTTTTTTAPPPTTTTTTVPPPPSYRQGDEGPEVLALQERLISLGFWLPGADGSFGQVTAQAVMAFQKSAGLGRDGIAGPQTLAALATASPMTAREGGDHIEIDLARQLMIIVRDGQTRVFNTSTGRAGWRTPPGRFTITREIDGVRKAPLGDLYRPKYFNQGIALHGSPSIPAHPASHGCTRLHDAAVDFIWANGQAPIGTPVWVY